MAWFFPFLFVVSVAFRFSVAITEEIFGSFDQIDSMNGRILHLLCLIAIHLGLTLPVLPGVRIWVRKRFRGYFVKGSSEIVATNWRVPSANTMRIVVGLFVAVMGWVVNAIAIISLGRELSGVLSWGINLAWTYLCYAWIFHGSRPPQSGSGVAPPGE